MPAHVLEDEARRLLAEYASDLLSIHDEQCRYLYASASSKRLFGWDPEELIGRDAYELVHPADVPAVREDHEGRGLDIPGRVRYRLRCKGGDYRWVETRSLARREADGNLHIVCITRDVHDEERQRRRARAAEAAMLHTAMSQRLVGLVRGLAHEINNPLSAAFVSLSYAPDLPAEMGQALRRIRDVVRELGLLAELEPGPPESLDLAAVVERVLALTDEQRRAVVTPSLQPVRVRADRARLYQL
ncbi:MAG: PAS domain-containing protein, partial [Polyangiales bacterium]